MLDAVILAAGLSRRMGTDKIALEISGKTILDRIVVETLKSEMNKIVVVTRFPLNFDERENPNYLHRRRLHSVINYSPELGMSSSIKLGLAQVSPRAEAVMIILADQVWLNCVIINILVSNSKNHAHKIIAPTVKGRRTNPVIFPAHLLGELQEITGETGGRDILSRHANLVETVELGDKYDDSDIDTPDDYYKILYKSRMD
jgi:molybdenum cofactor cytidylyltransferase